MKTYMMVTVDATGFKTDEIALLKQLFASAGGSVEVITKGVSENDGRNDELRGKNEKGEGGEEGGGCDCERERAGSWQAGYEEGFGDGYRQHILDAARAKRAGSGAG